MSDNDTEMKIDGLEHLLKALKNKPPTIRVGILGSGNARDSQGGATNDFIGMQHEFGSVRVPKRSFLREPLADNIGKAMESSGALDADILKQAIKTGSVKPWCDKIAVLAEGIVLEAFDSGGYGKWKALKPSTLRDKKNAQILVETGQLRNSITSEVIE
jgi:hypothetical protein